jgi:pyridoxamine 5'-phosphate oxidase
LELRAVNPAEMRKDYSKSQLREADLHPDPIQQFLIWFDDALAAEVPEPNAMVLATASLGGSPSARVILLKGIDSRGFSFFTSRESRKGRELDENPRAALVFYWHELERQVRVEGAVVRVSDDESDDYFQARPRGSQLAAWASPQSQAIPSREALEAREREVERKFGEGSIPRPPYWGGFRVVPSTIEFWQGGANRLHDRVCYSRRDGGDWVITRLGP